MFTCEDCEQEKSDDRLRHYLPVNEDDPDAKRICLTCSTRRPPGTTYRPATEGGR